MTAPTPAEFWQSLIRARLLDAGAVAALRAEHSALPPAAAGDVSAPAIAAWLVNRGTLSRWQAKQLVTGGPGPLLLGDYRLLERHDRAADTLVFTGRQGPTGRLVTLVVLNAKRCRDPQVWNAIVARAAVATRTTDPMLVRAWSLEQVDGARFVVCEHVAGSSLADEVERLGPLPPDQAGLLAWQVARAVAEIHAHGGTHGGLSLDALCREASPAGSDARQGRVRLQQFPLVYDPHLVPLRIPIRDADAIERLGRRSAFVAPELAAGGVCTASSDVYAIGGVLSALLTGRGPCWSGDAPTTLAAAGTRGPTPLPATVPPEIKGVVERMLDRDPNRRLTNATEAADALARCLVISDPRASSATVSRPPADSAPDPAAFEFTAVADRGRRGGPRSYRRERARRQATWFPWIGIVTALLLVAGATAFVVSRSDESKRQEPVARTPKPAAEPRRPPPADAADEGVADASPVAPPIVAAASPRQVVVDDPSLPWVSPTNGPPPTLAYLPTGAELVLLIRLAEVKADDEGRLFLRSLGPAVESALARLVTLGGGDESAIDLVQAAFQVENGDELVGGYTVSFGEGRLAPADDAARQRAWGPTKPITIAGETVFEGKTLSFWVPQAEEGRVLVIAPTQPAAGSEASPMERMIGEVAPLAADESLAVKAVVPDTLETLVGMLDADRHLTVLAMPQQLLKTGRGVLAGALAPLADPLDAVCGEAIQAAAVSLHFGDACYVEVDAVASADVPAPRLARELAGRIDGLVDEVEGSCAALDPDPYGRVLVLRLPAMLRILAGQVRSGAEGKVAVLNAYLPRHAAHNIALAAELALAQLARTTDRRGGGGTVAVAPAGVLDRLGKRMTLSFARDTLERSLQVLAEEAGVPIEFLGGDLEPEGIMKNRSFSLDERDKTAADILRAILATADPEGRLVYVVKEQDGVERVLITTRTAAESRGDPLPPAYAPQSQP